MRTYLFIRRTVVVASLALIPWIPALSAQAVDQPPGAGTFSQAIQQETTKAQPSTQHKVPTTRAMLASAAWVDEITTYLSSYQTIYPGSNFTPYYDKLTLVQAAVGRGDRRAVKVQMGTFFKMLAQRAHGVNEVAAEELTYFAQMVTPVQEYGISVPKSVADQYGSETPSFGSAQ